MRISFIIYDPEMHISVFPMGIAYLASTLRAKRHEVHVYNMAVYHFSLKQMHEFYSKERFDVIGIGLISGYFSHKQVVAICEVLNKIKERSPIVLGGHGPTPAPEYFLKKTNTEFVCMGESEITLPILLEAISNKTSVSAIEGVAYRDKDNVYINHRRKPPKDLDSLPLPAWDLFPIEHYALAKHPVYKSNDRSMGIMTNRGCPYKCNFCYRLEDGIRYRKISNVIEEMAYLNKKYNINYFQIWDELMMTSKKRVLEICDAILSSGLNINFYCNGRLNFASAEVLKQLKKAGCRFINYGIESADQLILDKMDKHLNIEQIESGLSATVEAGIQPGVNLLFGNIGDNKDSLEKGMDILKKYNTKVQLRTLHPPLGFPGTPLFDYTVKKGYIKDVEDFYVTHTNSDRMIANVTELTEEEYYHLLYDANSKIIDEYYDHLKNIMKKGFYDLYFGGDVSFRGARHPWNCGKN